jgi:hypothetical protein
MSAIAAWTVAVIVPSLSFIARSEMLGSQH